MSTFSRRLMLLRHAESDRPAGIADHQRPLSAQGQEMASMVGAYLTQEALVPDLVVVSGATRTRATWELVQKSLPEVVATIYDDRVYEAHPSAILDVIRASSAKYKSLLLVGHNPGLYLLALSLIGRGGKNALARLRNDFPPAGLVVIDFDVERWKDVADHSGVLERYVAPAAD